MRGGLDLLDELWHLVFELQCIDSGGNIYRNMTKDAMRYSLVCRRWRVRIPLRASWTIEADVMTAHSHSVYFPPSCVHLSGRRPARGCGVLS
jgi:hypothetical protein